MSTESTPTLDSETSSNSKQGFKERSGGPSKESDRSVKRFGHAALPVPLELLSADKKKKERRRAPEARQLHVPQRPEHIGQMLIAAEAASRLSKRAETGKAEPQLQIEKAPKPLTEKRVETMNRVELLNLSEKIVIDGSSLRQIYESHLIGERGLRRLIQEHLHGGDLKRILRQEIVEREIDFERDPIMRDMAVTTVSSGGAHSDANTNQAGLKQLLEHASVKLTDSSEEAAFYKARSAYDAQEHEHHQRQRQMIDVAFAAVIILLLGAVIFLFIARS
jgi:hypothetical protein